MNDRLAVGVDAGGTASVAAVSRDGKFERSVRGGPANASSSGTDAAAASIVAKVTRDRYMHHADVLHPGWSFAEHVGYSTPVHREAILRQGVSPLHRMSFRSLAYQQLAL